MISTCLFGWVFFTLREVAEPGVDLLHAETGPPAGSGRYRVGESLGLPGCRGCFARLGGWAGPGEHDLWGGCRTEKVAKKSLCCSV